MTPEEYWHGDPRLARSYLKAEEYRRERENYVAWLQGLYIANAISATVGNAFIKEGTQPTEYPEKPFPLNGITETEEEKEAKEAAEAEAAELYLKQFIDFGKGWGKKDGSSPQ